MYRLCLYNRYQESNFASQEFNFRQDDAACFDIKLSAVNGSTSSDHMSENKCDDVTELCAYFDACIMPPMIPMVSEDSKEPSKTSAGPLLVRMPTSYIHSDNQGYQAQLTKLLEGAVER